MIFFQSDKDKTPMCFVIPSKDVMYFRILSVKSTDIDEKNPVTSCYSGSHRRLTNNSRIKEQILSDFKPRCPSIISSMR